MSHVGFIVNADDWGRDGGTTDAISACLDIGSVSSVSAMVFMADSERAAALALEHHWDAGLHLNFTTPFSSSAAPESLRQHQQRVQSYLRSHRLAQTLFHPGLVTSFDHVVAAQLDEFERLYVRPPRRLDGHHHMHLCMNVLIAGLLPEGTVVRRNVSLRAGQASLFNRTYRRLVDRGLARRHRLVDYLFNLRPVIWEGTLAHILQVARSASVELETHPDRPEEYLALTKDPRFREGLVHQGHVTC